MLMELLNWSLIPAFLAVIINSVIYLINSFKATDIERKLMSNFQRFKYPLSVSVVFSLIFSVIFTILYLTEGTKLDYNSFIGLFILFLAIYVVSLSIVDAIINYRIFKRYEFKIKPSDSDKDLEWKIIRVNHKGELILQRENEDEYRIVKDYYGMSIIPIEKDK